MEHCKWSDCKFGLHYVQYLFLNLFEFIFHLYYDVLHLSVIALASCSVDFATHLLCDEPQLLALSMTLVHRLAEVTEVVG